VYDGSYADDAVFQDFGCVADCKSQKGEISEIQHADVPVC